MARRFGGRRTGVLAGAAVAALLAVPGVASAAVTSSVAGGTLTVTSDADDAIAITCVANQVKINGADPGTGAAKCDAITAIDVHGGPGANNINLAAVTTADPAVDTDFPAVTSVTIDGGGGDDLINGSQYPDTIHGGNGNDRIIGDNNAGGTRDNSQGDNGNDTLVWNPGDGDDINEGGDGTDTIEVNGGGGGEQFDVKPSATPGRVQFDRTGPTPPGPFNIDIGTSEHLVLNAGGGNDKITGKKGLDGLIQSTFNGDDGNDTITGTDAADVVSGGNGFDVIATRDKAADQVECDAGFDLAFVDRRDTVRGCEIVLGGRLRVKHSSSVLRVTGSVATAKLTCVATQSCKGTARLLRGGKSLGSTTFSLKRNKTKAVHIKLGPRGRTLLGKASAKGLAVQLRLDSRDSRGNGWRTTSNVRLK